MPTLLARFGAKSRFRFQASLKICCFKNPDLGSGPYLVLENEKKTGQYPRLHTQAKSASTGLPLHLHGRGAWENEPFWDILPCIPEPVGSKIHTAMESKTGQAGSRSWGGKISTVALYNNNKKQDYNYLPAHPHRAVMKSLPLTSNLHTNVVHL